MPILPAPPRPLPPGWWFKCFRLYILLGVTAGLVVAAAGAAGLLITRPVDPAEAALFESGARAQAVILEKEEKPVPGVKRELKEKRLVYSFKAADKEIKADRAVVHDASWAAVKKGDTVDIVYDPARPAERSHLLSEREYYSANAPLVNTRIGLIILGLGLLVAGSNAWNFRKELRYYSHGIELAADCEKVEEKGDEVTYKLTYIWDGREYWKREKLNKGSRLVVDERGRAILIMEPRKPDHITLITRGHYDVEPPPTPPEA